ncbi:sugar phosphate isomerase/epimerase family protein [Amaricoccus sp. B4]|uniref:sugar phosphate isomerase/epimerase family protein n=1 Tax=Amaricoccus sp. B4 TaxID=3368557 RepID=UPI003714D003
MMAGGLERARGIRGPGLALAQFAGAEPPFDTLEGLGAWAAGKGYRAVQIPTWDARLLDLGLAAESDTYCDELRGRLAGLGLEISELTSHLAGQLVAVHPAQAAQLAAAAPAALRGRLEAWAGWAAELLGRAARASRRLGLARHGTLSGALLWPHLYPFPRWTEGMIAEGFAELARRWRPILDVFEREGVDLCFEIHPGTDLHDGASWEMFLEAVGGHRRAGILLDPSHLVLQGIPPAAFVEIYHARIGMFHVKDAAVRPDGRTGYFGGFLPWGRRAGAFRAPGEGDADLGAVVARLAAHGFDGWAVYEWERARDAEAGAEAGARFIAAALDSGAS